MSNDRWFTRVAAPILALLLLAGCGGDDAGDSPVGTPPTATYPISGTVAHADTSGLIISDGAETVAVAAGATSFAFTKPLADGATYTVTIATQPSGQQCLVENASGTISGGAVSNVAVVCHTLVSQPLSVGVTPTYASGYARILLRVSQVGVASPIKPINAILDTGSSGAVLHAQDVFPKAMLNQDGSFIFPTGQSSFTYNGITVTNLVVSRSYDGGKIQLTGNLGFAQLTLGSGSSVTTARVPILFAFARTPAFSNPDTEFGNIIGVNAALEPVGDGGTNGAGSIAPCTLQSTTICGLPSPLRYLSYGDGIDKGFTLDRVTIMACSAATTPCSSVPALTVGVTPSALAAFDTVSLPGCGTRMIFGMASEPVCQQAIQNVRVTSGNDSFVGPMIFDTGTPTTSFLVPPGMSFLMSTGGSYVLPTGTPVRVDPSANFAYRYVTDDGYLQTSVAQSSGNQVSNSGIGFFTLNSFVLDYTKALEGWHAG